ncbi:ABC transporter ATP-binding protein [Pseudonocardia alni]|uniref:ABC transporter ATP-binding protein n=1 Tax=Pseudonocardia alni TaxID=33907 RepID=UPI00280C1C9A|nr:ABC transporter ATP-binding protein [Pseudonocardia alni]
MQIRVTGLGLTYGTTQVIDDLDVTVADGESLVLLGESGCGKTSTMRCVAGLEEPGTGRIEIGDDVVFDAAQNIDVPPHRRNVGMVFQSYAIWPHRTVTENVAFSLRMKKVERSVIRDRVASALRLVGLEHLGDRGASMLSGGQMQRVALARSIAMEPSVLLLDEPLSNLDARLRERLRIELRELQLQLGLTTVYVTHDQTEAFALADRIALMQAGRIVRFDTPEGIYASPTTTSVARFLGVANLFSCRVQDRVDGPVVVLDGHDLEIPVKESPGGAGPLAVGIRAEDVTVSPESSGGQGWPGRLTVASFHGATVRYRVAVTGGPVVDATARNDTASRLAVGDPVRVALSPYSAQVLLDDMRPSHDLAPAGAAS